MGAGSDSKKQLGKILLQQKLVSAEALQEMLEDQKREPGSRLASAAARRGRVTTLDALRALAEQHGVPPVDLSAEVISLALLKLIPQEMARERVVLPFRLEGEQLALAMTSPQDRDAIEELEFVAGKKIKPFVALDQVLRNVINHAYAQLANGGEFYVGTHVTEAQLAALGLPDLPRAPDPLESGAEAAAAPAPAAAPAAAPGSLGPELDQAFAQRTLTSDRPALAAHDASARVLLAATSELCGSLARALREAGVTVVESESGAHALQVLRDEPARVLVLDLALPGMHGLDLCRRLRADPRFAAVPLVVIGDGTGGWRLARDLEGAYGVRHFFDRPFDAAKLIHTVRLLLDGREVQDELPPLSPAAEAKWSSAMKGFEQGDLNAAIAELESGVALEPQAFELHYHLGLLYGRRDDLFGAIRELEAAVRLHPAHFAAIKNLAVVYQRAGFNHKAVDAWERAMSTAPDDETRANIKGHMITLL